MRAEQDRPVDTYYVSRVWFRTQGAVQPSVNVVHCHIESKAVKIA
jgi:hypothetical protein